MGLDARSAIESGRTALGIEFGSTRIKAVLIDENHEVLAIGNYDWENQLVNNIWTYSLEAIWKGLQDCSMSRIWQSLCRRNTARRLRHSVRLALAP